MDEAWRRTAVLLALALAAGGLAAPVGGAGSSNVLAQGQEEGLGWSAHRVHATNSTFSTGLTLHEVAHPFQLGQLVYNESGLVFGHVFTFDQGQRGHHVHALDGTDVEVNVSNYETFEQSGNVSATVTVHNGTGSYLSLQWIGASAGSTFSYKLEGDLDVEHVGTRAGPDAFFYRSRDFQGVASLQASYGTPGARAQVLTERVVETDHRVVGSFAYGFIGLFGVDRMTVDTPSGTQECPCRPWSGLSIDGEPGTYRFQLTGAGANQLGEVFMSGADMELPPAPE